MPPHLVPTGVVPGWYEGSAPVRGRYQFVCRWGCRFVLLLGLVSSCSIH